MLLVSGPLNYPTLHRTPHLSIYTDGSGGTQQQQQTAGWGAVFYPNTNPGPEDNWLVALYGPVLTQNYDPLWLGATTHTNNTGEVSAIGEACRWLLSYIDLRPPFAPPLSATILYDSMYAYGVTTRLTTPTCNHGLVETVANLVTRVRSKIQLTFQHIKGHSGVHGNDIADQFADRGTQSRISPHCTAWTTPPEGPMGQVPPPPRPSPRPRAAQRRPAAALKTCEKCGQSFSLGNYNQHVPTCRGPGDANLTCKYCRAVFGTIMARKNHERNSHSAEALADGLISKIPKRGKKPQ